MPVTCTCPTARGIRVHTSPTCPLHRPVPIVADARLQSVSMVDPTTVPDPHAHVALEPADVVTLAERAHRLAGSMIEATTEYDHDEVPLHIEVRLAALCCDLLAWMESDDRDHDERGDRG